MIGPMAGPTGEQLHMAVQVDNKLGVITQQQTEQLERSNAQPVPPAVSFMDVVHEAPRLMELLTPECLKALTATCTQLRRNFRHRVTTITMTNERDQAMLIANKWPRLVIVVISTRLSYEEEMTSLDHFTPYLSKREWATMVRIKVEEGGRRNWFSRFKHSVALVVRARHQSSEDMDTKAYDVALTRLATEWVAKTRSVSICMYSTSKAANLNPTKHLHTGNWACLESICCIGQYDDALPVSCFWDMQSSNLQNLRMYYCSLGADMIQVLVTICPHLRNLTLTECKVDAAALACLSQACFSRLCNLSISTTLLGCHSINMQKTT